MSRLMSNNTDSLKNAGKVNGSLEDDIFDQAQWRPVLQRLQNKLRQVFLKNSFPGEAATLVGQATVDQIVDKIKMMGIDDAATRSSGAKWIITVSKIIDFIDIKMQILEIQPSFLNQKLSNISPELNLLTAVLRMILYPDHEFNPVLPTSLLHSEWHSGRAISSIRIKYSKHGTTPTNMVYFSSDEFERPSLQEVLCQLLTQSQFAADHVSSTRADKTLDCRLREILIGLPLRTGIFHADCLLSKTFPTIMQSIEPSIQFVRSVDPSSYSRQQGGLSREEQANAWIRTSDLLCRWLLPVALSSSPKQSMIHGIDCRLPYSLKMKAPCSQSEARESLCELAQKLEKIQLEIDRAQRCVKNDTKLKEQTQWIRTRCRQLRQMGFTTEAGTTPDRTRWHMRQSESQGFEASSFFVMCTCFIFSQSVYWASVITAMFLAVKIMIAMVKNIIAYAQHYLKLRQTVSVIPVQPDGAADVKKEIKHRYAEGQIKNQNKDYPDRLKMVNGLNR